jgi:hypothetical protein
VLELQVVGTGDAVFLFPGVGGAITAGSAEAVQDCEEDGAFHWEFKTAVVEQFLDDGLTAGVAPQALEDKSGAEATSTEDGDLAVLEGGQEKDVFGEAGTGSEEGVEVTRRLEMVQAAQGDKDALADLAVVAGILDDLEVATGARSLDAEEHGDLGKRATTIIAVRIR